MVSFRVALFVLYIARSSAVRASLASGCVVVFIRIRGLTMIAAATAATRK